MPRPVTQQTHLKLSPEAWSSIQEQISMLHYKGTSGYHGASGYLAALLIANPTPDFWADNRPAALKDFDTTRLLRGKLPLWLPPDTGNVRAGDPHAFNTATLKRIAPILDALAHKFYIWPKAHGHLLNSRLAATIEAIALSYLVPRIQCPPCSHPANPKYFYQRRKKVPFELSY